MSFSLHRFKLEEAPDQWIRMPKGALVLDVEMIESTGFLLVWADGDPDVEWVDRAVFLIRLGESCPKIRPEWYEGVLRFPSGRPKDRDALTFFVFVAPEVAR